MNNIGRYIVAFLLAVPAAWVVAEAVSSLALSVLPSTELRRTTLIVAFFVGLVTFTPLISMVLANWRDRNIAIRLISVVPTSLFLAFSPALMVGSIAEYVMPGWEDGGSVGIPVFILGFAACALWLARPSTGRQAVSRGCGLIALTAFAIPAYTIGYEIVTPPVSDPIFPPWAVVMISFFVGVPVGVISGIIWYALRRQPKQEIPNGLNESRTWRG